MALAQETVVATQVEVQRYGYQAVSLTNFTSDTLEPALAAGSRLEIGGALFVAAGNESITGWSGIAVSSDVYIKLTVSGASATASFTTTAPTWSTSAQGWYSGSDRYIGGLYKDGSGNYAQKWLYEEKQIASVKRYGSGSVELTGTLAVTGAVQMGSADTAMQRKIVDIGDWNMNTTDSINVAHGLTLSKIRSFKITIRSDAGSLYDLMIAEASQVAGYAHIDATNVVLGRTISGFFDSGSFDSTSYNRGWIVIEYVP